MQSYSWYVVWASLFLAACNAPTPQNDIDYFNLPALSDTGVNMIVEIPAGTNLQYQFDPAVKNFVVEQVNDQPRVIDFLPYPGNYGFIPSTYLEGESGRRGDPLEVLLMCAALPTGTVLSIKPIGMLELIERGEPDTKLIAIPTDTSLQVIRPSDFQDFIIRYDGARRIIETWFLQFQGIGQTKMKAWQDEKAAMAEIKKRAVRK